MLLFLIFSSLLLLSSSEKEDKSLKIHPYFHLSPYTPCMKDDIIKNKSKKDWLIKYKIATIIDGSFDNNPFSDIYILILAQQKSVIRPRMLELSFNTTKERVIKIFYQRKKNKPQINPILLQNDNTTILNMDKSIDINYENVIDNKTTGKKQKYKIMKTPKVRFTIIIDKLYQYNIKLYLTTSIHHFEYLKWIPSL